MTEIYKNNFGIVHEEFITLTILNRKQKIALKNIIKIEFLKRQKLHMNYAAFLLSTYLLFFIEKNEMSNTLQTITLVCVTILMLASFFVKQFQYKLIVTKKNDFVAITVTKKLSQDADDLAKQTMKQIVIESRRTIVIRKLSKNIDDLTNQTKKQIETETRIRRVTKKLSHDADDFAKQTKRQIAN